METDAVAELLLARENEAPDGNVTKRHDHSIDVGVPESDDGMVYPGTLTIEYKPEERVLVDESFYHMIEGGFVPMLRDRVIEPEAFVEMLYRALVATLFPGNARLERPWEHCSLLVEVEYGDTSESNRFYASAGRYR